MANLTIANSLNSLTLASNANTVTVESVDIYTVQYFVQPPFPMPYHKEVE